MSSAFIVGQILGFLLGVLACFAFWGAMQGMRPNLRVATNVAFNPKTGRLGIKVVNWSRRKATNVEVHVATASRPAGKIMSTRKIAALRWSTVLALDAKQNIYKHDWGLPTTFTFVAHNAAEMLTDLQQSPEDRRIVFTITARDGWSGTASVQRVTFPLTAVKPGWYRRGLSLDVRTDEPEPVEANASLEAGDGKTA